MDSSNDSQMILGLNVDDDPNNQNISFEDSSLGTKRLHLDSESSVDTEVGSLSRYLVSNNKRKRNDSSGLMQTDGCEDLADESMMLGSTVSEGMSSAAGDMMGSTFSNNDDDDQDEEGCVLIQHINIKEPLSALKSQVEEMHGISLEGYDFYLQDSTPTFHPFYNQASSVNESASPLRMPDCNMGETSGTLAEHKNLVEQCVQGCGTVQVNLQLKVEDDGTKKINILDVLKPSDSYLIATGKPAFSPAQPEENSEPTTAEEDEDKDKNLIRWVVDQGFKENQQRLGIPLDPVEWDQSHVRHWLLWAVRQFNLTGIKLAEWMITGAKLCSLTIVDFKSRVPYDPSDIFWTHLELLRRCKFVAVMQNPEENQKSIESSEDINKSDKTATEDPKPKKFNDFEKNILKFKERKNAKIKVEPWQGPEDSRSISPNGISVSNNNYPTKTGKQKSIDYYYYSGSNGQVQLWQFLLGLLTDKNHRECIQWLGAEGEFKLIEPERVAQLWGQRKNKPSMNYEKLSRALRYYYDGDMIAKVHGKRFVYKFVCDLKQLLGYSAFELNRLVIEAEMRAMNNTDAFQHSIFGA